MYLFVRRARIAGGRTREAMGWATETTEKVNHITALGVALYQKVFSPELGTISWSAFVPDLVALEAAGDKLAADDDYVSSVDRGADLTVGGFDDALYRVVHGAPDQSRPIEYVTAVRAVCANGQVARGMTAGIELARKAEEITGTPTLFVAEMSGAYGGVGWLSGHSDIASMERAQDTLGSDPDWLELVDREAGPAYATDPEQTYQRVYRRLL